MKINPTLIVLAGCVWHVNNRLLPNHEPPSVDLGKQLISLCTVPPIPRWTTLICPIYLLFSNTATAPHVQHVIEHCAALYILTLVVNTIKRIINPYDSSNAIDYVFPLTALLSLTVCYLAIIPSQFTKGYLMVTFLLATLLRLVDCESDFATCAMINDVILCTLMFMIYKRDLNFVTL